MIKGIYPLLRLGSEFVVSACRRKREKASLMDDDSGDVDDIGDALLMLIIRLAMAYDLDQGGGGHTFVSSEKLTMMTKLAGFVCLSLLANGK